MGALISLSWTRVLLPYILRLDTPQAIRVVLNLAPPESCNPVHPICMICAVQGKHPGARRRVSQHAPFFIPFSGKEAGVLTQGVSSRWSVKISGDVDDLNWLVGELVGNATSVELDPDGLGYRYRSARFDGMNDAASVLAAAKDDVRALPGIVQAVRRKGAHFDVGAVFSQEDGRPDTAYVFLHDHIGVEVSVGVPTVASEGSLAYVPVEVPVSPKKVLDHINLVVTDPSVAKVYRLWGDGLTDPWVDLYRIYEVSPIDRRGVEVNLGSWLCGAGSEELSWFWNDH